MHPLHAIWKAQAHVAPVAHSYWPYDNTLQLKVLVAQVEAISSCSTLEESEIIFSCLEIALNAHKKIHHFVN